MKRLRLSLMALALTVGIIGAFAFKTPKPALNSALYDWIHSGTGSPSDNRNGITVGTAQTYYGCTNSSGVLCGTGTKEAGTGLPSDPTTVLIFYN